MGQKLICKIATNAIDMGAMKPVDCLGLLFRNANGIYNVPTNLEDIIMGNAYFDSRPMHVYILSNRLTSQINTTEFTTSKFCILSSDGIELISFSELNKYHTTYRIEASTDATLTPNHLISRDVLTELFIKGDNYTNRHGKSTYIISNEQNNPIVDSNKSVMLYPTHTLEEYEQKLSKLHDIWLKHAQVLTNLKENRVIDLQNNASDADLRSYDDQIRLLAAILSDVNIEVLM